MDKLIVYEKEMTGLGFAVAVGTTGHKGGDAGHGGRTYIEIHKNKGLDIKLTNKPDMLIIEAQGDFELDSLVKICEYILGKLK